MIKPCCKYWDSATPCGWNDIVTQVDCTLSKKTLRWFLPETLWTYERFLSRNIWKKSEKGYTSLVLNEKIARLKMVLEERYVWKIDPITFIAYLYYEEQLSVTDLLRRLNSYWDFAKWDSSLSKFLRKTLHFPLRDAHEITPLWKKRIAQIQGSRTRRIEQFNHQSAMRKRELYQSTIETVLKRKRIGSMYPYENRDQNPSLSERVEALLAYYNITAWVLLWLHKSGIWPGILASYLRETLTSLKKNPLIGDIHLSPWIVAQIIQRHRSILDAEREREKVL